VKTTGAKKIYGWRMEALQRNTVSPPGPGAESGRETKIAKKKRMGDRGEEGRGKTLGEKKCLCGGSCEGKRERDGSGTVQRGTLGAHPHDRRSQS